MTRTHDHEFRFYHVVGELYPASYCVYAVITLTFETGIEEQGLLIALFGA